MNLRELESKLRSEMSRIALTLNEQDLPEAHARAILTRLDCSLYPLIDEIDETNTRNDLLEMLDKLRFVVESRLEVSHETLNEAAELQAGNVKKLANDSIDVALDAYFEKAAVTLDATGMANLEDETDKQSQFSAVDFASDIATLLEKTDTLLDLKATVARRAYNHVAEKYGPESADNLKQVLSANFDVEMDSGRDAEDERMANRPAAAGAGGGGGAVGGTGGA